MKTICLLAALAWGVISHGAVDLEQVRNRIDAVNLLCVSNRWNYSVLSDALNFECLLPVPVYRDFAASISNDWLGVLQTLDMVATNNLERLFVLGVGKQYDEDFYIDYMDVLSDMKTNSLITAKEFNWARASTRYDLMSCLIRRYQEPKVIDLVNKYKISLPAQTNRWNAILSGAAYTNYLEEVEIGLWQ